MKKNILQIVDKQNTNKLLFKNQNNYFFGKLKTF